MICQFFFYPDLVFFLNRDLALSLLCSNFNRTLATQNGQRIIYFIIEEYQDSEILLHL